MIKRQHTVAFAAAKIGLQLHNWVAALAAKPPKTRHQQILQALCQVSAPKEFFGIAIFRRRLALHHIRKINRELGLGILSPRHILMRLDDQPPRLEAGLSRPQRVFGGHRLLGRSSGIPFKARAQQFLSVYINQTRLLLGANRFQQPSRRISHPIRGITVEGFLMRPFVAGIPQFKDVVALGWSQLAAKNLAPVIAMIYQIQPSLRVKSLQGRRLVRQSLGTTARVVKGHFHFLQILAAVTRFIPRQHIRPQPILQRIHNFFNANAVCFCHRRLLHTLCL